MFFDTSDDRAIKELQSVNIKENNKTRVYLYYKRYLMTFNLLIILLRTHKARIQHKLSNIQTTRQMYITSSCRPLPPEDEALCMSQQH